MAEISEEELPEGFVPTQAEVDDAVNAAHQAITEAEMLATLEAMPEFVHLFQEKYTNAYAITNTMGMAYNDSATDQRVFNGLKSRGDFHKFLDGIRNDGIHAKETLASAKQWQEQQEA